MAKIRSKAKMPLWVPGVGRDVAPGEIVEVPDSTLYAYTCQTIWEPHGKADQAAHDAAAKAQAAIDDPAPEPADA